MSVLIFTLAENGVDIRFIQAVLGHEYVSGTEIYTRVSAEKLREVLNAAHPARMKKSEPDD